jgi:hypothetical protein
MGVLFSGLLACNALASDGDRVLAGELQRMWTLRSDELVDVIATASRNEPASPSLSLLLAIAHAETNGDVLDVSEAGAVGLAQATPPAMRQENIVGRMYVTRDYLDGVRAYILKKPLHDVDVIADDVVYGLSFVEGRKLLDAARVLRREGFADLDLMREWADDAFFQGVAADDHRNLLLLEELDAALYAQDMDALRRLRDRARSEYRASISRQQSAWRRYQRDLVVRRDALLECHFGTRARKLVGYEAGEMLAEELDVRFSPTRMAHFLVRHLERRATEAFDLTRSDDERERMTAALYNGGSHNVKRMLAGLILYLPETQKYMQKVPATRRRLDRVLRESGY